MCTACNCGAKKICNNHFVSLVFKCSKRYKIIPLKHLFFVELKTNINENIKLKQKKAVRWL